MSPTNRIHEIDQRLQALEKERRDLEVLLQQKKDDKWSEEGMTERLRKKILSRFGSMHKIKLAKLILNSRYNDEYYTYSPLLLLLDAQMNEIEHDLDANEFCPDSDEQEEYYERTGNYPPQGSVTIRYA